MADPIIHGKILMVSYEDMTIQTLKIKQAVNQHTQLNITATIPQALKEKYLDNLTLNSDIEIVKDEDPIFIGMITELNVTKLRDVYTVDITALSHTYKMDIMLNKKSFQYPKMLYGNLIAEIVAQHPDASCMDKITDEDDIIKFPIIQYKETDWDFLIRMASRFNTCLIPNCLSQRIQFYFGFPAIEKGEPAVKHYKVFKDINKFKKSQQYTSGITENDFIYYQIESENIYDLGDTLQFQSRPMYIIETEYAYDHGVIKNICTLCTPVGAKLPRKSNVNISGCSLFGTVLATARDNLRIHLDIDAKQDIATAFWFPYATMYASQDETGWYCMPELNDTVRLYFPDDEESGGMAINSIKPHDPNEDVEKLDPDHRMANTNIKYLRTAYGKEIKFRPNGLDIIAKDGTVFTSMDDDGTVYMNSNNKISFTAVNDIEMKAKNIHMKATDSIEIKSKSSEIKMKDNIEIQGKNIKNN